MKEKRKQMNVLDRRRKIQEKNKMMKRKGNVRDKRIRKIKEKNRKEKEEKETYYTRE